jgi:dephospho-CoA kinase
LGAENHLLLRLFKQKGIPVYDSDFHAKKLMNSNPKLKNDISELFGSESYNEEGLNSSFLATVVFSDNQKLLELNDLVHPLRSG